jgi:hypothetical protein
MATNNLKAFLSRALSHHVASGNLAISADSGRCVLTASGREWFAKRLNDSAGGGAIIRAAHIAMRDGEHEFSWGGTVYQLVDIDAKALRLPRTIKTYLAPQYCAAGSTVSQAFYSGLWI